MRSTSRPCSPIHHHEGHTKLASSHRASPVRMGPSTLKKGLEERRVGKGGGELGRGGGAGVEAKPWRRCVGFASAFCRAVPRVLHVVSLSRSTWLGH